MTAAEVKAVIDILLANGARPEQIAQAAKPSIGRVDRSAIDALLAAGVTAAQIAAVGKTYIDKLYAKRAQNRADQERSRARARPGGATVQSQRETQCMRPASKRRTPALAGAGGSGNNPGLRGSQINHRHKLGPGGRQHYNGGVAHRLAVAP